MDIDHLVAVTLGKAVEIVAYANGIYSVFHCRAERWDEILEDHALILRITEIFFCICKNVLFRIGLVCNGNKFLDLSVIDNITESVKYRNSLAC